MNRETNEITPEYNTEASASDHASSFSGSDISEIPALDAPGENRFKRFIRKICCRSFTSRIRMETRIFKR